MTMPVLHNPFGYESVVARTQIPTLPHQKPDFYRELLETFKILSMDSINFSKWTNRREKHDKSKWRTHSEHTPCTSVKLWEACLVIPWNFLVNKMTRETSSHGNLACGNPSSCWTVIDKIPISTRLEVQE